MPGSGPGIEAHACWGGYVLGCTSCYAGSVATLLLVLFPDVFHASVSLLEQGFCLSLHCLQDCRIPTAGLQDLHVPSQEIIWRLKVNQVADDRQLNSVQFVACTLATQQELPLHAQGQFVHRSGMNNTTGPGLPFASCTL